MAKTTKERQTKKPAHEVLVEEIRGLCTEARSVGASYSVVVLCRVFYAMVIPEKHLPEVIAQLDKLVSSEGKRNLGPVKELIRNLKEE